MSDTATDMIRFEHVVKRFGDNVVLDGLDITKGYATVGHGLGGGVYIGGSTATFTNCNIHDNLTGTADGQGGGVGVYRGTATFTNCTIRDAAAHVTGKVESAKGGMLHLSRNSSATLTACTIKNSSASAPFAGSVGGVAYMGPYSRLAMMQCAISEARVSGDAYAGGGVTFGEPDSTLMVEDSNYSSVAVVTGCISPECSGLHMGHGPIAAFNRANGTFMNCVITDVTTRSIGNTTAAYGGLDLYVRCHVVVTINEFPYQEILELG
mgnify:CR=1 FL=1